MMTPDSSSESVAAFLREADRDRWLAMLYAPAAMRPALLAVHALDLELAKLAATTTEPMIGRIRLAWWRERLQGLDRGEVPAQPVLQALAADALPGLSGALLSGFEGGWLALLDGDIERHVALRAAAVGGALAILLGADAGPGAALLRDWAAGEAARAGHAVTSSSAASPALSRLRPLAGLGALGRRDLATASAGRPPEPRATAGRQWVLLRASLIGR